MQTAVAVPEGRVAAVMRRLCVRLAVFGLLVLVVFEVQVSVQLEAQAAVVLLLLLVVVVMVGSPVQTRLGLEGGGGDHRSWT